MIPTLDTVATDSALPAETDVVVIGGGIIGVTAAINLAKRGLRVTLCEKGRIAGEQSGRNWGWVRVMGRDSREIPLVLESQRLWGELTAECGQDTGFRRAGIVYTFDTPRMRDTFTKWAEQAREYQVHTELLDRKALQARLPGISPDIDGGLYAPTDCKAEPQKAVPAFAALARRLGVTIVEGCAVRGIERAAGRVTGVVTERGSIRASQVLLAGGAWSRLFCGNLGLDLPALMILGSVSRVEGVAGLPDTTVGGTKFAYRPRLDGGFTVAQRNASISELTPDSFRLFFDFLPAWASEWRDLRVRPGRRFLEEARRKTRWALDETTPFETTRVLDPKPDMGVVRGGLRHLSAAMPAFGNARITHAWGGLIDVTPDAVPVIGPVASIPGLFVATGFSGHGFGIGPGAGRLAADLVSGGRPLLDPTPYRLDRFPRLAASAQSTSIMIQ